MAVTDTSPQSAKGWKQLTRALAYTLPGSLGAVRRSGKRMVALTSPNRKTR